MIYLALMTVFYKNFAAHNILWRFKCFKIQFSVTRDLKRESPKEKLEFSECSQLYPRDLKPPLLQRLTWLSDLGSSLQVRTTQWSWFAGLR